jgi:type I restriction enzyme S subunit
MEAEVLNRKKVLAPKLRFKDFEEHWEIQPLQGHIELISGFAFKGEEITEEITGVPLLRGINITEGKIRHSVEIDRFYIGSTEKFEKLKVKEGDLVLGMDGSKVGKNVAIVSKKDAGAILIQRVARIRAKSNADLLFIYHHINSKRFHSYVDVVNTSSGIPHISSKQINEFKIGFPSLPEQQKIASFLSAVDEKIQLLTRKKELLTQYKKGLMQQLFSGNLRFKDEYGKEFPEWEEKRLGEIGNTFNGLTGKTKEDFGEGMPYIQYMQIFASSKIDLAKCGLVQVDKNENQQRVQIGDVFFTTSSETPNEIGTCSVLLDNIGEMYLNSFCFGYRPNSLSVLNPQFAQYLFRSKKFRKKIIKLAQGSTRYNMSKIELMKLKVSLPSSHEQQKIATYLAALDTKIERLSTQITQTQTFKKGLLQQMFV